MPSKHTQEAASLELAPDLFLLQITGPRKRSCLWVQGFPLQKEVFKVITQLMPLPKSYSHARFTVSQSHMQREIAEEQRNYREAESQRMVQALQVHVAP